jgi:hypothetical protein
LSFWAIDDDGDDSGDYDDDNDSGDYDNDSGDYDDDNDDNDSDDYDEVGDYGAKQRTKWRIMKWLMNDDNSE